MSAATSITKSTLVLLLTCLPFAGTAAAPSTPSTYTGFYSYEVAEADGSKPVLRCFVETTYDQGLLNSSSSTCPSDAALMGCVNTSAPYGSLAKRTANQPKTSNGPLDFGDVLATTGSSMAAIITSAVQAVILVFIIGPSLLLFGTAVPKAVIVVQSIIQFGYVTLINMMLGADIFMIGRIAQASYELVLGALTLIIAALLREEINRLNKGLLTGRLLIYPVIEWLAAYLFERFAECKLFGATTDEFPFGTPTLCKDKFNISYLASLYIYHGLKWLVIATVAFVGQKFYREILIVSCALSGATLQTASMSQMMLLLLRWWDAYWKVRGYDTGRAAQGSVLVATYATIVYYVLTMIGCLSMLTIRQYVEEIRKAEQVKKDIINNLGFRKIVDSAMGQTQDPKIKGDLRHVKKRAMELCEALVAKDEMELAEIYPLFRGTRKKKAKKLRKQLKENREKDERISSMMFEHKRIAIDEIAEKGAAIQNKVIWTRAIEMPQDKESKTEKGYTFDKGPDGENLTTMTMDAYHEHLASIYDNPVDKIRGQKFLFQNRIIPVLWPQMCKWPKKWKRDAENELDPNTEFGLGQGSCMKRCCPPLRFFFAGPVFKNYLLLSRVGKWILMPMNALNLWVMSMQYSTRSMKQMMGDMIARSKTLSKFQVSFKKGSAKVGDAVSMGIEAANIVQDLKEAKEADEKKKEEDMKAQEAKDQELYETTQAASEPSSPAFRHASPVRMTAPQMSPERMAEVPLAEADDAAGVIGAEPAPEEAANKYAAEPEPEPELGAKATDI